MNKCFQSQAVESKSKNTKRTGEKLPKTPATGVVLLLLFFLQLLLQAKKILKSPSFLPFISIFSSCCPENLSFFFFFPFFLAAAPKNLCFFSSFFNCFCSFFSLLFLSFFSTSHAACCLSLGAASFFSRSLFYPRPTEILILPFTLVLFSFFFFSSIRFSSKL